jgi:DNA helicase-2/ATP-dependent DNA helicase PcrA
VDSLLNGLTEAQRTAVCHRDGPQLILAGPGSGKTRVVTHRIAWLLREGVPARQIVALTFTNKAAEEMSARVDRLAPGEKVWLSTFHRFCARLLRQYGSYLGLAPNFSIYDVSDSRTLLRSAMSEAEMEGVAPAEALASAISWAKNRMIRPEQYQAAMHATLGPVVERVYAKYQARLLDSQAVDFDDLLFHVAVLLDEHSEIRAELDARYRYVMVDEYQDTNLVQYRIARLLSLDYRNLSVTGDPDQSIYSWRGANIKNILEFEHDYPDAQIVRLEQNYRSTQRILRTAAGFIAHNRRRKEKELYTENADGAPVAFARYGTHAHEAAGIVERIATEVAEGRRQPRDFAIFYRVNALSRPLEQALNARRVPFQLVGAVEFFQRKEIKDLLAYLMLLNNPRDEVALRRVINTPARGIGPATIERLEEYAHQKRIPLLEAARQSGLVAGLPKRAPLAVAKFMTVYDALAALVAAPVRQIISKALELTGYRESLLASNDPADEDRLANIEELLTAAREFDAEHPEGNSLESFLEQTCLINDSDNFEFGGNAVTLMTLHAAKGLEFPVVFIGAIEQGILPHERSLEDNDQIEEERRLLFVGMTRAREELHLSHARYREFRGRATYASPSSFISELPTADLEFINAPVEVIDPRTFSPTTPRPAAPRPVVTATITTAAALAGEAATEPVERTPPEDFVAGMIVRHPEYGVGKITSLSEGAKRSATVVFPGGAGEKTFVLQHSQLSPVRNKS